MYRFQVGSIVLISSSHDILVSSHDILVFSHDILLASHDITLTSHDILCHFCHGILHSSRIHVARYGLNITMIINRLD
jgi:hypothetical protein